MYPRVAAIGEGLVLMSNFWSTSLAFARSISSLDCLALGWLSVIGTSLLAEDMTGVAVLANELTMLC